MTSAVGKTVVEGQMASGEYLPIFQQYMDKSVSRSSESAEIVFQTGTEVAEVVLEVAENEHPPMRTRTSEWAEELCELKTKADPDGTKLMNHVKAKFL
ncbi:hypothetical protein [Zobellia laminariae]|uniref:hypothetical protein n=1 Tax=Zobellia laminariae TaxID=248906 RepID=UPI0026F444DE|nr:hypothetical protein [Zobellia laminariae]WKX74701.1 hypothetical protein Q5W13_12870 [Zobellia laminariae]